jgi:hypothetical protein
VKVCFGRFKKPLRAEVTSVSNSKGNEAGTKGLVSLFLACLTLIQRSREKVVNSFLKKAVCDFLQSTAKTRKGNKKVLFKIH